MGGCSVIIRCERCSTLYDLDETLLAPEGSSVQCVKCQAVFTATPPRPGAAAAAIEGGPPAPLPQQPLQTPPVAGPPSAVPSGSNRPAEQPRPARAGPNIYRRPQPAPAAAPPPRHRGRAGAPPRDAVSAMDARLRNFARWKLAAVPLGAVLLLLLAYGAWSSWKRRPDPETERQRTEALALIAQDDAASLARAVELLEAIQQGDHASNGAAGARGLARALIATALAEEAEPSGERLDAALAEKARLEREQPPGFEDAQRALAMEVTRLEVELTPMRQKLEPAKARASEELKALAARPKGAGDAARGQAVLAVLDSNAEALQRATELLRAAGPEGWADLVELWLAARRDGAAREQAITKLVALVGARPELIRARFVLARALLSAGRREEASSTVGRLLAANPRHERAQRLRSLLAVPPPIQPAPPPPPPPRPVWTPRPAPLPAPAAANTATPVPVLPRPAASEQPVVPAPEPAAPEVVAPPPPPKPKPKPPEPDHVPDPTEG
jgi:predicted Zn finger-like uncharacterized protein